MTQSDAILVGAIINAVVVVAGFFLNHFARRKEARGTRVVTAEITAMQTKQLETTLQLVQAQIELKTLEAAAAARVAYQEANAANLKIIALQTQLERALAAKQTL